VCAVHGGGYTTSHPRGRRYHLRNIVIIRTRIILNRLRFTYVFEKRSALILCRSRYLVEGRKVHLRLYVAVAELEPLRILMFGDGLVLFANAPYTTDAASLSNKEVHLTNAAVAAGGACNSVD
jgi:hypothetical protein